MGRDRWTSFRVIHHETDLWVAVNPENYCPDMESFTLSRVRYYRDLLNSHIISFPHFLSSLRPLDPPPYPIHPLLEEMYEAGSRSDTGPMSAVAGAIAEHVCNDLCNEYDISEIVIENGGDIFMKITSPAVISVYAGTSPLSEKIGVEVTPDVSPLSVCCSSGTIGHSLSFGTADACMIACRSGALADAFATAFCNQVKSPDDTGRVAENALLIPGILSVVIIKDEMTGLGGKLEIKLL